MAAQFSLDAVIAEMERGGVPTDAARNQLHAITDMQRMVGAASPSALAQMRAEIVATALAAQTIAQQSQAAANATDRQADLAGVTATTRQTIQNVAHELFEQKKLDPYLQFQSAEDEAEYRKREAERQAYIRAELAKGTPQGALNAAAATRDQLEDARDHGADRSPDFAPMLAATEDAERALRTAMPNEPARSPSGAVPTAATDELDDILAVFRDAGVTTTNTATLDPDHGLNQAKQAVQVRSV